MNLSVRIPACIFLVLASLAAEPAVPPASVIREGLPFQMLKKGSFIVYYRGNAQTARARLNELQLFEETVLGEILPGSGTPGFTVAVTLFANQREYVTAKGVPASRFAHYDPRLNNIYSTVSSGTGPLFHETVHAWTRYNSRGLCRLWFEEGLASFYESPMRRPVATQSATRLEGQRKQAWRFDRPNWRQKTMAARWTRLAVFVNHVELPEVHSKAQARIIFIYLARRDLLSSFVRKYFDYLDFDFGGGKALAEVTGKSLAELDFDLMHLSRELTDDCNKGVKTALCGSPMDIH